METTTVYNTPAEVLFLRQSEELVPGQAFFKAINTEDSVSFFKINQTIKLLLKISQCQAPRAVVLSLPNPTSL